MTARDRLVILIVVVAAAVVGSWLMVIQPQRDRAAKLGDDVSAAQTQLAGARSKLAQARVAQKSAQNESAQLAQLGQAVPTDDEVPSLIYELQSAASGARIDFRGLQTVAAASSSTPATAAQTASLPPNVTVSTNGFPTEQFTFTFGGTYFQLAKFIDRVQRFVTVKGDRVSVSGRLLALNSIGLAASPDGFPQITATISATTYLMPASPTATGGATPTAPSATTSSPTASTSGASPAPASAAVATPIR